MATLVHEQPDISASIETLCVWLDWLDKEWSPILHRYI